LQVLNLVFIDEKNEARILPVIAPVLYAFAAVLIADLLT